ncbi:hypothetical protein AB3X93_02400 [Paraburkholderia sp. BR14262]|uniref:hypothetical protein n=2 Tax=unclassified Paraburkholderia TaxID=2615204 RepID=UPI0034CD4EA5
MAKIADGKLLAEMELVVAPACIMARAFQVREPGSLFTTVVASPRLSGKCAANSKRRSIVAAIKFAKAPTERITACGSVPGLFIGRLLNNDV